jgi:uncharacterized protein (DUF1810 family)
MLPKYGQLITLGVRPTPVTLAISEDAAHAYLAVLIFAAVLHLCVEGSYAAFSAPVVVWVLMSIASRNQDG